jgi:hypothetical protein
VLLASGGFGLPGDVVAQHGVEGCDHLAHDGDDDDFGLFVGGGETGHGNRLLRQLRPSRIPVRTSTPRGSSEHINI